MRWIAFGLPAVMVDLSAFKSLTLLPLLVLALISCPILMTYGCDMRLDEYATTFGISKTKIPISDFIVEEGTLGESIRVFHS